MKFASLPVLGCFLAVASGCVSIPKIEGDMQARLEQLAAEGKDHQEIKSPILAGALNVILPGAGEVYAGDVGDGVLTLLTSIFVVPYFLGIADAVQESRVQNAKYTIGFYEKSGFKFADRRGGGIEQTPVTGK